MQTKGVKKGESAGEGRVWLGWVRKIRGEKKIVSFPSSLSFSLNDRLWLSAQLPRENEERGSERGRVERSGRWIDDERRRTIIIRQAFAPIRFVKAGRTGGQQLTQLQDKLSEGPTRPLSADPAALRQPVDFLSLALFSLPLNVCPSSGAPGRRRSSRPWPDFNLFRRWKKRVQQWRDSWRGIGCFYSCSWIRNIWWPNMEGFFLSHRCSLL